MVTIHCSRFEGFLPCGATKPFWCRSADGRLWVVKAIGKKFGPTAMANEWVVGSLAGAIGLPWPKVVLVRLSSEVMSSLREHQFPAKSSWACATSFIDALSDVDWPEGGYQNGDRFEERNREHILRLFPDPSLLSPLYGKAVLDKWVILEDRKYDTLKIDSQGRPVFLDASFALGGSPDFDSRKLSWDSAKMDPSSPYLDGVLTDLDNYETWLAKVEKLNTRFICTVVASVPRTWKLPPDWVPSVRAFLCRTRDDFVPAFRKWLEGEKAVREVYGNRYR